MMDNETCNMESKISDKDVMGIIWKYFEHHGNQRMTHINFYTILSSAILLSQFTILSTKNTVICVSAILGLIECIVSFVFYKIDERTMFLVKHAESTMMKIEERYAFYGDEDYSTALKIFSNEEKKTNEEKRNRKLFNKPISHRKAYRILLLGFSCVAVLGMVLSFIPMQ